MNKYELSLSTFIIKKKINAFKNNIQRKDIDILPNIS